MSKFSEAEIQKMMKNLDLSREEAIQLLQDDEDDVSVELTAEQKKVVKKMTQSDRKKETAPRKRERKVDKTKKRLLDFFRIPLEGAGGKVLSVKSETELEFWFDGATYNIKLVKHREKKKSLTFSTLCAIM